MDTAEYIKKLEEENRNLQNQISTMGSERLYLIQTADRLQKEVLFLKEQIGEKPNS